MTDPTTLTRRRLLRTGAGVTALAAAGCLGTGADGGEAATAGGSGELGDPATRVTVNATADPTPNFQPDIVHVEPGGTVEWEVVHHRHTVTAYHPDTYGPLRIPEGVEPWDSGTLRAGNRFERTFDREGIYDYLDTRTLCAPHEALGAVGRVVVGWPDPEGEPAIRSDPDELRGRAVTVMAELDERTRETLSEP